MIIWINGAYGVGKTTIAELLKDELHPSFVFDPELVGNGIRDNYPEELFYETFEQYDIWLSSCYELLKDIYSRYKGTIIVPMTLLFDKSYQWIIEKLKKDGIDIRYIFLDADYDTLYKRMLETGREEKDGWCVKHIDVCLKRQKNDDKAIHINTINRTPSEIVDSIKELIKR